MKEYIIGFTNGLLSYLDEVNIKYRTLTDQRIEIYLRDDKVLFELGMNFQVWKDKNGLS